MGIRVSSDGRRACFTPPEGVNAGMKCMPGNTAIIWAARDTPGGKNKSACEGVP